MVPTFVRAPTRDGVRARTSRLLLSVRLTRTSERGDRSPEPGEGTLKSDGGASWHGLNIGGADGGGDLRSVGHESQWGMSMPRRAAHVEREGERVANAAEGETPEPPAAAAS